ncbi:oxepin-CoA hydrolase, alternative type [Ramlibacter sp.]|uniref:oxepin-CoA hydrolase, alternative type n=1 Tax=Ramlibacter sp. TaxID=1917967 RepID=UPI003D103F18
MPAELQSASHGRTMVLTISNPEQRNALGPDIYAAGVEALIAADSNPEVRSVVITGAGGMFCAGGNLQRLQAMRTGPKEILDQGPAGLHAWIEEIRSFPKPVIAAVEGAAAGAGFSLALACDFIVAAENATFVMAYANIALSPDAGGSWFLSRAMPRQLASELLMCAERIAPARLKELGLVNRVTPAGGALDEALAFAERLNDRAPNAVASVKELLNDAPAQPLLKHLDAERTHFVDNLRHANAGIGIDAFLAKKPPRFE